MPAVAEQENKITVDEYQCDKCKHGRTVYSNNKACKDCDGTNHLEPITGALSNAST